MSAEVDKEQVEIGRRLQIKWLRTMEALLDNGEITSTDLATLARVLSQNGWTLDPTQLPSRLQDKLTSRVDPEELDDHDRSLKVV